MKIITAIASTTHLDRHNERMAKSALEDMALQIRTKYIPQLINHDFNKQIGVLLYGRVISLEDGEFALYVVFGIFENESERQSYKIGSPNTAWKKYKHYLDGIEKMKSSKTSKKKAKYSSIADLLEVHLDSTQVMSDGTVYKMKRFIAATGDLRIEIRPKDHTPQHFHVISRQRSIDARFDLNTLECISLKTGKIKRNDIEKIQNFFETHPEALSKLRNEHKRMV